MPSLGVNIDHVATIRQARYREVPDCRNAEPDPIAAALASELAGACGITAHLREDRRHIQDSDIRALREKITTKLNLEMGASEEIVRIALDIVPEDVCLVPESRREVTTEGGLNCRDQKDVLGPIIARLRDRGIRVSLFIDPEEDQVAAASSLQADFVELHTGAYANATSPGIEIERLMRSAGLAVDAGLRVNAGHGLSYENTHAILGLPGLEELNIGHSIISRAVSVGISQAVREMCAIIESGKPLK
jgi:pyridoxine 5-phosphate synthase